MNKSFIIIGLCALLSSAFDAQAMRSVKQLENGFVVQEYVPQYNARVRFLVKENVNCKDTDGNPVIKDIVAVSTNDGHIACFFTSLFNVAGYRASIYQERFFEAIASVLFDFSDEYGCIPEKSDKKIVHGTPQDFSYLIKAMLLDKKNERNFMNIVEFGKFFPDIELPCEDIVYSQPIPDGTLLIATPDDVFCNMQQYLWLKNIKN